MPTPSNPSIYHIVHGNRLNSIITDGELHCDATMVERANVGTSIGMASLKERRRTWTVPCYPSTCVGDYVPFNFCPRSVMLHRLHVNYGKEDNTDLTYSGGQSGIVHLEAELRTVVKWANSYGSQWTFCTGNAAAADSDFYTDLQQLCAINWEAVRARYWPDVREAKQAEFLVHGSVPWQLISRIGVISEPIRTRVEEIIGKASHKPAVVVMPGWYY